MSNPNWKSGGVVRGPSFPDDGHVNEGDEFVVPIDMLKKLMTSNCTHPEWIYRNTENGIVKVCIKCEQPLTHAILSKESSEQKR